MKKILCLALFAGLSFMMLSGHAEPVPDCHERKSGECMGRRENMAKIRMVFQQEAVVIEIFDSPAGREFLERLPLTLEFDDYAGTEKIAWLPEKLKTKGTPGSEAKGDFAYYVPWGNLAVFYKGYGNANGLFILGRILSGKDRLAKIKSRFTVTIEMAG